ncbi:site-2 protease family protein [Candidatus Pyrohabitans sp.]
MNELAFEELVARGFLIRERYFGRVLSFGVEPLYGHERSFDIVLRGFEGTGYYPIYRERDGRYFITIVERNKKGLNLPDWAHLLLLLATLVTVTLAGYLWWAEGDLYLSVLFAAALMLILGGHELGHYIAARRRNVAATLPFFIPVPPNIFPFGTMGAVINIRSPIPDRRALLEVGVAGPLTGFLLSLPFIAYGLMHSTPVPIEQAKDEITFFMPLAMLAIAKLTLGNVATGASIDAHPLAMAGWIGLFVTSLNLLPMGQLDGGHVVRALFPKRYRTVYRGVFMLLILAFFVWPGWLFWAVVAYLITKLEHPGPLNDVTPLDTRRKLLGLGMLILLILTFMPVPFISTELLMKIYRE